MKFFWTILVLLGLSMQSAYAQETHQFRLTIAGLNAAKLTLTYSQSGTKYSAMGRFEATGLAAAISKIKYKGSSSGRVGLHSLMPLEFSETSRVGSRITNTAMIYENKRPRVTQFKDGKIPPAPKSDPTGTHDLITASALILRDQTQRSVCTLNVPIFDGERQSRVVAQKKSKAGELTHCQGQYARVAGFSAKELERGKIFPFTLIYRQIDEEVYRLIEVVTQSTVGRARLTRY